MLDQRRPARIPAPVFEACCYFLPRLLFLRARYAPQVHWGDITLALDGFPVNDLDLGSQPFWDEWRRRWVLQAERHLGVADSSPTEAGRSQACRSAAACYHWAEFMDFGDAGRTLMLRRRVRDCFQRSLADTRLDLHEGVLPAVQPGGVSIPYWLAWPAPERRGPGPMPCIILCNGLDSMTEVEILSLAESYLDRGIAALLFDGPGQGIHLGQVPLQITMEEVVAALAGRLQQHPDIDADRLAFLGISFGGYFALRVSQALGPLFRCVVNLSGGPLVAPFDGLPRRLKADFTFALMGGDAAEMQDRLDGLAIDQTILPGTPVLSIHGGRDDIFPVGSLLALDSAWQQRHELRVYPEEAHVCLNLLSTCSLEAADWVAERLLGEPGNG
jgi:dienelactone hydrolase